MMAFIDVSATCTRISNYAQSQQGVLVPGMHVPVQLELVEDR